MALSDIFSRRRKDHAGTEGPGLEQSTKVLPRFLSRLGSKPQAVLLDLGSGVGSNVTFFGEHLGCKIFVEDVSKDLERHVQEGALDRLPEFFATRFSQATDSVDGILCWDLFDYLSKPQAKALAAQLSRILKPDGVLLAFFSTTPPDPKATPSYARYTVTDAHTLRARAHPASRGRQPILQNRDIQLMFAPLTIAEQYLMKTRMREVLLRKPAAAAVRQEAP